ncbi:MAG: L-fucose/L-arabinose isomerase family protein [Bacteroidales bacterium]|jgi:L-arabinose isomerase|nr:L-fucose/L-arabinose isomerase family protein [Bacteroidales bacterium]
MKDVCKIGLFGTGLETYWGQFEGLKDSLTLYQNEIKKEIEKRCHVPVADAGMIDRPEKAIEAASFFAKEEVDLVFLYVATYCLSSTILPIAQRLNCPVIVLNLQPVPAIDYEYINSMEDRGKMTGYWLAHCQACSVPEIANVFNRSGLRYDFVTGYLKEEQVWQEIEAWVDAARVQFTMKNNRLGILGHYYCGMLDVYTDITLQSATFGTHMELLEMCELKKYRDEATEKDIRDKINEFYQAFEVDPTCEEAEIRRAAQTSVAMDKLIQLHRLGSLAYYYEGINGNDYENIVTSVIAGNTLLTGKGIPIAGECEVKNAQAMKILSEFGIGGSFSEFYAMDFNDDIVMLGHDGPAHFAIAEGKVKLVPLSVYHGKPGKGLSIQMNVRYGDVTILSVCEGKDGIFLLTAEGESVAGPTLKIGNTNSRYRFPIGAREFINQWSKAGPSHHCAVGVGHISDKIKKLGFLLNIPVISIC